MANEELLKCIENSHIRAFLEEHLDEYVQDVLIFSEQVLAHIPSESKFFVKSAGLAFFSTPMISFVSDLPWQTVKTEIVKTVSDVFQLRISDYGQLEERISGTLDTDHTEAGFIKQAIVAAFTSVCKSAEDAMGAILVGSLTPILGKYIALYIAGMIDEVSELKSWPIVQPPSLK